MEIAQIDQTEIWSTLLQAKVAKKIFPLQLPVLFPPPSPFREKKEKKKTTIHKRLQQLTISFAQQKLLSCLVKEIRQICWALRPNKGKGLDNAASPPCHYSCCYTHPQSRVMESWPFCLSNRAPREPKLSRRFVYSLDWILGPTDPKRNTLVLEPFPTWVIKIRVGARRTHPLFMGFCPPPSFTRLIATIIKICTSPYLQTHFQLAFIKQGRANLLPFFNKKKALCSM